MTEMDALVLGDFIIHKSESERALAAATREEHLAQFQLD